MTQENETSQENAKPEVSVEKMQEMGKKFSGFLGNLAEKAKNIDVKELAEKAKNIDVKELAEKAKTKADELKAHAGELTAGKTASFVVSREEIAPEQMKEIVQKAAPSLTAPFPPEVEVVLADIAAGAPVIARKGGATPCALTADSVIFFEKYGEQYGADVVFLDKIVQTVVVPPRGDTAGRFIVKTPAGENKSAVPDLDSYARVLMFVKKMKEIRAK